MSAPMLLLLSLAAFADHVYWLGALLFGMSIFRALTS